MKTSGIRVLQNLPTSSPDSSGDKVPDDLFGATIVSIGAAANSGIVGEGRLVIDYRPHGSEAVRRVILGFCECDMWLAFVGIRRG